MPYPPQRTLHGGPVQCPVRVLLTMLSLNKTVRDVALEMPQATRVFEKLKIDYCCGGDKPLGEACATAGVEVANLEQMLSEAAQTEVQGNG